MRTLLELQQGIAQLLSDLRKRKGLSKFKIATLVGISDKTWARYESGTSAPTIPEFIQIYSALNEDAFRDVLNYLYPNTYLDINPNSSVEELRNALSHFSHHVASDRTIHELAFMIFGNHGSSFMPQLEMFTMLNHLPMKYKYFIADDIMKYWEIAELHGEITCKENIMPHIETVQQGLELGKEATLSKRNYYSFAKAPFIKKK